MTNLLEKRRLEAIVLFLGLLPPVWGDAVALRDPGFESSSSQAWFGPEGGGTDGGSGSGAFVQVGDDDHVRSGTGALKLEIHNGGHASTEWSYASQKLFCIPYTKVHAEAWIRSDDDCSSSNAAVQLRIEYFEDDQGSRIIPTHAGVSEPFVPDGSTTNWTQVSLCDRVPRGARTMVVSIVLMSQSVGSTPVEVWVDDVSVTTSDARRRDPLPKDP